MRQESGNPTDADALATASGTQQYHFQVKLQVGWLASTLGNCLGLSLQCIHHETKGLMHVSLLQEPPSDVVDTLTAQAV